MTDLKTRNTPQNTGPLAEHHVVTAHGRLRVQMRDGQGPALLLLHGNSFSGDVFGGLASAPELSRLPLIIPDLPGHGGSDNAATPAITYSTAGFAACITEMAEQLGLADYVLFGWSLGGQIGLEMLDRAPGLIGVATCGSAAVQRGPLGIMAGFHFTRDLLLAGKGEMTDADARRFAEVCTGNDGFAETVLCTDPAMRPALSRSAILGKGRDQRAAIAETRMPVCLMLGTQDPFIRADTLRKVTGPTLHRGEPILLENAGHASFLDAPDVFAATLAGFHAHAVNVAQCLGYAHTAETRKAA
ncbi:MAG: alpha/beta hydrolase [Rhizobiaceae bacterium]|jgi:pimeloyl-ACP methyl ester carboxylesterase|nr:alpha/beta hydrolase [Rhizobiaceae bacterium]